MTTINTTRRTAAGVASETEATATQHASVARASRVAPNAPRVLELAPGQAQYAQHTSGHARSTKTVGPAAYGGAMVAASVDVGESKRVRQARTLLREVQEGVPGASEALGNLLEKMPAGSGLLVGLNSASLNACLTAPQTLTSNFPFDRLHLGGNAVHGNSGWQETGHLEYYEKDQGPAPAELRHNHENGFYWATPNRRVIKWGLKPELVERDPHDIATSHWLPSLSEVLDARGTVDVGSRAVHRQSPARPGGSQGRFGPQTDTTTVHTRIERELPTDKAALEARRKARKVDFAVLGDAASALLQGAPLTASQSKAVSTMAAFLETHDVLFENLPHNGPSPLMLTLLGCYQRQVRNEVAKKLEGVPDADLQRATDLWSGGRSWLLDKIARSSVRDPGYLRKIGLEP